MTKVKMGFEEKLEKERARYTKGFLVLIVGLLSQICRVKKRQKYRRRNIYRIKKNIAEAPLCELFIDLEIPYVDLIKKET